MGTSRRERKGWPWSGPRPASPFPWWALGLAAVAWWLATAPGLAQVQRLPPPPPEPTGEAGPWDRPVVRQVAGEEPSPGAGAIWPEMLPWEQGAVDRAGLPPVEPLAPMEPFRATESLGPSEPWTPRAALTSPGFRLPGSAELDAAMAAAPDASELDPDEPRGGRPGAFQKVSFLSTWLATGPGADDFGMVDLELWSVFGFPCPTRKWPLAVTPGFGVHFFDKPIRADLPGEVYDAYVEFRWLPRLSPWLKLDLGVTPGWYSDFQQGSRDALRISGYGAGILTCTPTFRLMLGLAYLDRKDVEFLPLGGLIWTPNEDTRFELVTPRPRIARRVYWSAGRRDDLEDWLYVVGEFGGGAWAIRRANGSDDTIAYHDYRILFGAERKRIGGLTARIEAGYVFGRKLEYGSASPDVKPDDTVLVRAGLTY